MQVKFVAGATGVIVAVAVSAGAAAAPPKGGAAGPSENWQQIGHDDNGSCDHYFDPHTLTTTADGKSAWFMRSCAKLLGKPGHQFRSSVFAVSFHCEDHTSAIMQMVTYPKAFGTGMPVDSSSTPPAMREYSGSPPGTMGEAWQIAGCGHP